MDKKPHGPMGGDGQDTPFEDPEDAEGFGARRLLQRLPTKTYCTAGNQRPAHGLRRRPAQ
ncbi:unnamed protein product [Ectocarpus sp. 8 AP-2014]